ARRRQPVADRRRRGRAALRRPHARRRAGAPRLSAAPQQLDELRADTATSRRSGPAGERVPLPRSPQAELELPMTLTLRPISPADEAALIGFHERCSVAPPSLRFAAPKPRLRPHEAQYLCGVDDHRRGALVITDS